MSAGAHIAEQFQAPEQQRHASIQGMWVFLATEVLFFTPLFFGYIYGRSHDARAFAEASHHTHIWIGTTNTALLLTSSLFMALAVRAGQADAKRLIAPLLALTAVLGTAFMVLKGIEYYKEWNEGFVPALHFTYAGAHAGGVELFYTLYFLMTGLHAVHLTIGIVLVCGAALLAYRGHFGAAYHTPVEVIGLYWHFVDIIWVFLYPLIYLLERYR